MTIREKINKFNPFFENLVDKLNKEYNVNYYDKPTVTLYEEKSRYGYYDIINNNIPCIVTFIAAPKGSSLLTDNKVSNFLKRYNIDNIKFQILSRFNGEEIMFVIPIELEDD